MTPDDIPALVEIEKRTQKSPWTAKNFETELSKPYSFSLVLTDDETDSQIAGYIVYWLMFDECDVLNIAVDLSFQRRGFAKRMLRQAVNDAIKKSIRKTLLNVRKSNSPAMELYQSSGFAITHVRKGFYSDGEDAYEMALDLSQGAVQFWDLGLFAFDVLPEKSTNFFDPGHTNR